MWGDISGVLGQNFKSLLLHLLLVMFYKDGGGSDRHFLRLLMILEDVVIEVALGRERFVTANRCTMIGFFTCVEAQVGLEISFFIKSLFTVFKWANEISNSIVLLHVDFEALLSTVGLVAASDRAHKVLLRHMGLRVVPQMALRHERLVAAFKAAGEGAEVFDLLTD